MPMLELFERFQISNTYDILCNIWSNHPRSLANNNYYFSNAHWLDLSRLSTFFDGSFK
jgi:hypothetical protein